MSVYTVQKLQKATINTIMFTLKFAFLAVCFAAALIIVGFAVGFASA